MENSMNPLISKRLEQQKNQNLQNNNQMQHLKGVGAGLAVATGAILTTPVVSSQIVKNMKTDKALKISENKVVNVLNEMMKKLKNKGFIALSFDSVASKLKNFTKKSFIEIPFEGNILKEVKNLNKNHGGAAFHFNHKTGINQAQTVSDKLHLLLY